MPWRRGADAGRARWRCSLPLSRHRLAVSFGGRSSSVETGARAGAKVKEWRPERGEPISEREVIIFFFFSTACEKSTSGKNTGRKRRSRMLSAWENEKKEPKKDSELENADATRRGRWVRSPSVRSRLWSRSPSFRTSVAGPDAPTNDATARRGVQTRKPNRGGEIVSIRVEPECSILEQEYN